MLLAGIPFWFLPKSLPKQGQGLGQVQGQGQDPGASEGEQEGFLPEDSSDSAQDKPVTMAEMARGVCRLQPSTWCPPNPFTLSVSSQGRSVRGQRLTKAAEFLQGQHICQGEIGRAHV